MFEKGKSGNPNGRPRKNSELIERLSVNSERFVNNIMAIANGEIADTKVSDMIKANELALAYLYGKPIQTVDQNIEGEIGVHSIGKPDFLKPKDDND